MLLLLSFVDLYSVKKTFIIQNYGNLIGNFINCNKPEYCELFDYKCTLIYRQRFFDLFCFDL